MDEAWSRAEHAKFVREINTEAPGKISLLSLPAGGFLGSKAPAAMERLEVITNKATTASASRAAIPRAQEHYLDENNNANRHPDKLIAEPLQLLHSFYNGSCFRDTHKDEWEWIGQSITVDPKVRTKEKMKNYEISVQKWVTNKAVQGMRNLVEATGGIRIWRDTHPLSRDYAIRHAFHQNPIAISEFVFHEHSRVIDFEAMFMASDEESDMVAWRVFTEDKFVKVCHAAYRYVVDWEGKHPISGADYVYQVLRSCPFDGNIAAIRLATKGVGNMPVFKEAFEQAKTSKPSKGYDSIGDSGLGGPNLSVEAWQARARLSK